jgi:hypothetical protein
LGGKLKPPETPLLAGKGVFLRTRAHGPGARYLCNLYKFNNFRPENFVQIDEKFFPEKP